MESYVVLAGYLIGLLVLIGAVAHVSNKLRSGEEFSALERLVATYAAGVVLVWMYEGYRGASVLPAFGTALRWPLAAARWLLARGR